MDIPKTNRWIWTAIACAVCFIINLFAYLPGFLSPDSMDQYQQSFTHVYNDWHPLAMAVVWSLLDKLYQGPQLMLVFQLGCLWLSCYLLLRSVNNRFWKVAIWIFAFTPFVQNFAGYIIKDSQMALSWLLAVSILFYCTVKHKKIPISAAVITALLLVYGCLVRPNALSGAVPLYILWAVLIVPDKKLIAISLYTFLLLGITFSAQRYFSYRNFNVVRMYPANKLYIHDMAGIWIKTGDNVFPSELYAQPAFDTANIRSKYHPATYDMLWWNEHGVPALDLNNDAITAKMNDAWRVAITQHPFTYVSNRWEGLLYFLRIKKRSDEFYYCVPWIPENQYGLKVKGGPLYDAFIKTINLQKNMPYMRPWFWFILNILLVAGVFADLGIYKRFYMGLVLSGLLYILPQFFISQTDTDFRYVYWNCIACALALIMLVASRTNKKTVS
jgi:hypothetical protein